MKLLHKLLPIATIASVSAIVAPHVTSCAKVDGVATWSWDGAAETWTLFEPTIAPREEVILTGGKDKLTKDYYHCINKNPKIFAEDLVFATSNFQNPEETPVGFLTKYIKVTTNSFRLEDYSFAEGSWKCIRASFDVILTAEINYEEQYDDPYYHWNTQLDKRKFELNNFPIELFWNEGSLPSLHFCTNWFQDDSKWSITMPSIETIAPPSGVNDEDIYLIFGSKNVKYDRKNIPIEDNEYFSVIISRIFSSYDSHYLMNTKDGGK